jgi:hypothetical protein
VAGFGVAQGYDVDESYRNGDLPDGFGKISLDNPPGIGNEKRS